MPGLEADIGDSPGVEARAALVGAAVVRLFAAQHARQGGFAGAVLAQHRPVLTAAPGPVDTAQHRTRAVADTKLMQAEQYAFVAGW